MAALTIMQAILVVTIAIGVAGGLLAWRERPEPGAVPLTILLAGQCWWSATLFFRIGAPTLPAKVFWVDLSWLGIAILPVAWMFFSFAYTGHTRYLKRRYVALAMVVPVLTALFSLTNGYHHLLYTDSALVEIGGNAVLERTPGGWFWVIAVYTYLLGLFGAIPLVQFLTSEVSTFRGQSVALLVGLIAPWATNMLYLAGLLPTGGIDPTPVAFSVSALAFLGALTRFQLLGTSPAPIRPARQSVFDWMQDGVMILDRRDNLVEMNESAADLVATNGGDPALGRSIESVMPQYTSLDGAEQRGGQSVFRTPDGRAFDVGISSLTDAHGRSAGKIVTFHDISDYIRQQQRLEVLNRVFRHNIRTSTQIIVSHADYLATNNSQDRSDLVQEYALEIEEFAGKIRSILDVFERGRKPTEPVGLETVLRGAIDPVTEEYPAVTVSEPSAFDPVAVDSIAEDLLAHAIRNAAQHNTDPDPQIWIDVARGDSQVIVEVSDNGPGIDEGELSLVTEGTETPLNHGSGLGLALMVWGTEIVGGQVTFEDREPRGTTVRFELPIHSPEAA